MIKEPQTPAPSPNHRGGGGNGGLIGSVGVEGGVRNGVGRKIVKYEEGQVKAQAFDRTRLTKEYSMNQMPMVAVAGLPHDPTIEGQTAYELISTQAVNRLILERAAALKLAGQLEGDLGPLLNAALDADDGQVRQNAIDTAHRLGGIFGRLIAILKTGQKSARPAWNEDIWEYWRGIRRVVVGGGLSTGRLGEEVINGARAMLAGCAETADLVIEQSAFGKWVTLVGLACRGWQGAEISKARVYDYGGTAVKMGWARYHNGLLESLEVTSRNHDFYEAFGPKGDDIEGAAGVAERMIDQIVGDLEPTVAYNGMDLAVLISMACYVHDGHPLEQGGYGLLGKVARRDGGKTITLQDWLAGRIGARLGRSVAVGVFHDGTAAACAYGMPENPDQPEASDTVLFVLGTAIGYGYPTGAIRKFGEGLRVGEKYPHP